MYTSLDASRPDPLFWRTLYLHVSALSPAGIVYLFLHQMHSIVGAVVVFEAVCLVLLPALFIFTAAPGGRGAAWYSDQFGALTWNWRDQMWIAILLCAIVAGAGYGGYLLERSLLCAYGEIGRFSATQIYGNDLGRRQQRTCS